MPLRLRTSLLTAFCWLLLTAPVLAGEAAPVPASALAEAYLALPTRPGVTLPVLVMAPQNPVGAVVLLAGGNGAIGVTSRSDQEGQARLQKGGNFLVRTRGLFAARGLVVAVMDAPSDHGGGMSPRFRFSEEHLEDIRALAAYLRGQYGFKPWLVGTSMGTLSAAWAAANLGPGELGGVVLTSTIIKNAKRLDNPPNREQAVLDAGLGRVTVPALVVRHKDDGCAFSAPEFGPRLLEGFTAAPRRELLTFEGGLPAQSDVCEAKAAHGYFGIEESVVAGIAAFILHGTAGETNRP